MPDLPRLCRWEEHGKVRRRSAWQFRRTTYYLGWRASASIRLRIILNAADATGRDRVQKRTRSIKELRFPAVSERPTPYANTTAFYTALGYFYAAWSRTDLAIDCAIWKALGTATPEEVHARVAAMKFGRKCEDFRSLLPASKFENIEEVEALLTRITDHSMGLRGGGATFSSQFQGKLWLGGMTMAKRGVLRLQPWNF